MDNQTKARFFGMHIGCKISASNGIGQGEYVLSGVSTLNDGDLMAFTEDGGSFSTDITDIKLILRPLPSITDEEAIEALTIATGLYLCNIDRNKDIIVLGGANHCSHAVMWFNISPHPVGAFIQAWNGIAGHSQPDCHDYMAVDYLRSINICVPFMGLDPISEGFAVLE